MSYRQNLNRSPFMVGTTLVFGIVLCTTAVCHGVGGQTPTPSPCLADGVCRPNHATWGYSGTRWRPWPGDPTQQPTAAETTTPEEDTQLSPFERPQAIDEDLRGPAKKTTPSKSDNHADDNHADMDNSDANDAGEIHPIEEKENAEPLPEAEELPDFEPQGSLQPQWQPSNKNEGPRLQAASLSSVLAQQAKARNQEDSTINSPTTAPSQEDAPPALPESLRRVSFLLSKTTR